MPSFIAKQPNGLYCRFSEVVDTVTQWNMTEEDYVKMRIKRAIKDARRDALDTIKHWTHPFDEVKRKFAPVNDTIEEFNELLKEMGDEDGLSEDRIAELEEMYGENDED